MLEKGYPKAEMEEAMEISTIRHRILSQSRNVVNVKLPQTNSNAVGTLINPAFSLSPSLPAPTPPNPQPLFFP